MDDCCGRLAAWPSSRRSPVKQPSHRAVGNPPISSAALFAQHARARRRSKAQRRSSARARQPGRDAARESGAQSRTRCRSGARQPIESETPESAISSESETPRSTTLGSMAPGSATLQNAISESAMPGPERDARKRGTLEHGIQKAHRCRPAEGSTEKVLSKEATTVRKCRDGASLQRNHSELSENAARGPLFRLVD